MDHSAFFIVLFRSTEIDRQVKTFMVRNKLRQAQIVCPSNEKKLFDREESRDHTSSLPSNDVQDNR